MFIGHRLWHYRESVGDQLASALSFVLTGLFTAIYALSGFLLALGWWLIAGATRALPWPIAWRLYARSQIAKYVPGNVFHLAGRHLLAANEGVAHRALLTSAMVEIVMCLVAAGLISLVAIEPILERLGWAELMKVPPLLAYVLGASSVVAIFGAAVRWRKTGNTSSERRWRVLAAAQVSYCLFFVISATLFLGLILAVEQTPSRAIEYWRLIVAGYAVAWAAGFVVPGAPGGLGVREAVLVAILAGSIGSPQVLSAALLMRLVTTGGDGLFFLQAILASDGPASAGGRS